MVRCRVRLSNRRPQGRSVVRQEGQCRQYSQVRRHRPGIYLGRRPPAQNPLGQDDHLRSPRQRIYRPASRRAGIHERHLLRADHARRHRPSARLGCHRRGASADPPVRS